MFQRIKQTDVSYDPRNNDVVPILKIHRHKESRKVRFESVLIWFQKSIRTWNLIKTDAYNA